MGTSSSTITWKEEKGALSPLRPRAHDLRNTSGLRGPEKGSQHLSVRHGLGCLIGNHSPLWVVSPRLLLPSPPPADGYCQPDSSWQGRNKDPKLQGPSLDEAYPWRCQGPFPQSHCHGPDREKPPGRALHPQVLQKTRSWGSTLGEDEEPQNVRCFFFLLAQVPRSRLRSLNLHP